MRKITILMLVLLLPLSACAAPLGAGSDGSAAFTPEGSPAAPVSGEPTATIDWFPATATSTPIATVLSSPTPELLPGLGPQIYHDDFGDLKTWSSARAVLGGSNGIILEANRLTLAVNDSPAVLFSLNNSLLLTNFYAEVNISVNRCFGADAYGLLFRASSGAYTYRFLLNCTGKARVEQTRDSRTLPLQDWLPTGYAPSGAPGQVKMGVWASGVELRFFLNDRYQFSVIDPLFKSGTLGFYVNAVSPEGMNINFSDLTVNSVNYSSPTPSATASKTPTPSRTPRSTP